MPTIAKLILKVQLCVCVLDALGTYFNKHSITVIQFISWNKINLCHTALWHPACKSSSTGLMITVHLTFWSIWGNYSTKAPTQNLYNILLISVFYGLGLFGGVFFCLFVWVCVRGFLLCFGFFPLKAATLAQCAFFVVAVMHLHKVWSCNGGQSSLLNIPNY